MPFFDDSGLVREHHRGPVIEGFAVFGEQVERMVAVNVGWALTLFPALVGLAATGMPGWLRIGLLAVSSVAVIPATGALFALARRAYGGEQLDWQGSWELVRARIVPSLIALSPLFALLVVVGWTAVLTAQGAGLAVEVVTRVAMLLLLVVAMFWGPLHAQDPSASAWSLLRGSIRLAWRYPGTTLKSWLMVVFLVLFGAITVAGLVLAAAVVVACLQLSLLAHVLPTKGWDLE